MKFDWEDKMEIKIAYYQDMWQQIKDNALFTIHKNNGTYPTDKWKEDILIAEHSPIRSGRLIIDIYNIPSFVITHFVRHNIGIEKYVATFRKDRVDYDEVPNRNTLQNMRIDINFQAFINISRKRYCNCASEETRFVWRQIMLAVREYEPQLYRVCVPECIYRCGCSEMFPCEEHCFGKFLSYCKNNNIEFYELFNIHKRYELVEEFCKQFEN